MLNPIEKTFAYGHHEVVVETNKIAKQTSGTAMVSIGDTVVMTTVVGAKSQTWPRFSLTVNYQEKAYAAGKCRRVLPSRGSSK